MSKISGKIGFASQTEQSPGVYVDVIIEKPYHGDVLQNYTRQEVTENVNDDFTVDNRFSIVADAYALDNLGRIRYILWRGTKWKVTRAEIKRPRLILSISGVYNG